MKYQIIGAMKSPITSSKNGKRYIAISVVEKSDNWFGMNATQLMLSQEALQNISIETESGEMYVPDGKKYYIDVDYNARGFVLGGRVYNG